MKFNKIIVILCFLLFSNLSGNCNTENENAQKIKLNPVLPSDIKISGYPGGKIDLCISERIKNQDIEHLRLNNSGTKLKQIYGKANSGENGCFQPLKPGNIIRIRSGWQS